MSNKVHTKSSINVIACKMLSQIFDKWFVNNCESHPSCFYFSPNDKEIPQISPEDSLQLAADYLDFSEELDLSYYGTTFSEAVNTITLKSITRLVNWKAMEIYNELRDFIHFMTRDYNIKLEIITENPYISIKETSQLNIDKYFKGYSGSIFNYAVNNEFISIVEIEFYPIKFYLKNSHTKYFL